MSAATYTRAVWLEHVPVPIFATVMGVTGLGLCWRFAVPAFGIPVWIGEGILLVAGILFVVSATTYTAKWLRYPEAVRRDATNPVTAGFLGQIPVSLLLLSEAALPHVEVLGAVLLAVGGVLAMFLTLLLLGRWLSRSFALEQLSPAWLVPAIAVMVVPILAPRLGWVEFSWFFFVSGLSVWALLTPLLLYRLIVGPELPPQARPTLSILMAPPAVAFLAHVVLVGTVTDLSRFLFYISLFTLLVIVTLSPQLARLPFAISWWAYTMPFAAVVLAAFEYAHLTGGIGALWLAGAGLVCVSVVVVGVALQTLRTLFGGVLFQPS